MSMHIFRAFPRSMLDLGKVHLRGTWFCSICPEVLSKWWGRAGLAFAENKSCLQVARHCVHRGFSTEDTPSLEGHLLGALEATCLLSKRSPCSCVRSCCVPWDHPCWDFALQQAWPCALSRTWAGKVASQMCACGVHHGEVSRSWGHRACSELWGSWGDGTDVHCRIGRQRDLP